METELKVKVVSKDTLEVLPEEGQTMEDFEGKEKQKELKQFQRKFAKDLHKEVIKWIKHYFKDNFEEEFLDQLEENYVESWDDLKAYGVKIELKEVKPNSSYE
jgi:uncharacterized membrane protein YheB (UPF0754 family)